MTCFETFTETITNWLTTIKYLCHIWLCMNIYIVDLIFKIKHFQKRLITGNVRLHNTTCITSVAWIVNPPRVHLVFVWDSFCSFSNFYVFFIFISIISLSFFISESNIVFSAVLGSVSALMIVCASVTPILVFKWKKGIYLNRR